MRFLGFGGKKEEISTISENYEPLIVIDEADAALSTANKINPNFKGEVEQKEIKFPVELGEEHPFDFSICEGLYKKFGFSTGVVDKFVDFVVGPGFYVTSKNERAQKICEQFIQDVNFDTTLRAWVKEGLVKGNGFLELGGKENESPKGLKVLNANYMYVKRNKFGKIEQYNQYTGGFKRLNKNKTNNFKPYQIAHLPFNRIGDMAYGLGIISPALTSINNLLQNEKDMHMLMNRKANNPYHIKMGGVFGGKYYKPSKTQVTEMGKKLEWLHNKHEWVTDGLTEIKVVDFGNIGEKFNEVLEYDIQMLFYIFQVPAVLMGQAKVPEGLAKVQMDAFERRIQSMQAEIEKVIEQHIFRRVLQANGIDEHVEFEWGRPSSMETYERLKAITELVKSPTTSRALTQLLEKQIVTLMNLNEDDYNTLKQTEEEERKREEERPQPIVPGQNATPPKPVPAKKENFQVQEYIKKVKGEYCVFSHQTGKNFGCYKTRVEAEKRLAQIKRFSESAKNAEEILEKYNNINEWLGFNFEEYKKQIIKFVENDNFDLVKATTIIEKTAGKLTSSQIKELKEVLKNGFINNKTMKEISNDIYNKVKPKDLYRMKNGEIIKSDGIYVLAIGKGNRSIVIARSEVSRVANAGAIAHFKEGGVKKIRWVSSFGPRTCPECASLNGQIFNIGEEPPLPLHPMCRCTVVPVREII